MDSMGGDVESREKIDREPRMHIMADLSKEKFSLHLSQCNAPRSLKRRYELFLAYGRVSTSLTAHLQW